MILINKCHYRDLNESHRISFQHIALERLYFHRICVFPLNILVGVLKDDGEGFIRVPADGTFLPLRRGFFYFVPCGVAAEYLLSAGTEFMTFHFNIEIFPGMDVFSDYGQSFREKDPARIQFFRDIFDDPEEHRGLFRFRSAVGEFCTAHWPQDFPVRFRRLAEWRNILDYAEKHGDARLSVAELAERKNMTPEAFSRKFTRDLGETPKQYLQRTLLKKIMRLFSVPERGIRQIADELSFSSEFYLSRFFRKHTGMTPGEYRKRQSFPGER